MGVAIWGEGHEVDLLAEEALVRPVGAGLRLPVARLDEHGRLAVRRRPEVVCVAGGDAARLARVSALRLRAFAGVHARLAVGDAVGVWQPEAGRGRELVVEEACRLKIGAGEAGQVVPHFRKGEDESAFDDLNAASLRRHRWVSRA